MKWRRAHREMLGFGSSRRTEREKGDAVEINYQLLDCCCRSLLYTTIVLLVLQFDQDLEKYFVSLANDSIPKCGAAFL